MCEFLFGSHDYWDEDFFDLKGAQDIVSMYFVRVAQDPTMVVGGINQILQYHKARPLGSCTVRYTPVFCNSAWYNLYMIRLQNYVLVIMTYIDKSYDSIQKKVEDFKISVIQSRLEIPAEEPPILLRLFAKRETLAMLYHNIKTGSTIFPQLRPGPEVQQREILNSFWNFFCEGYASLKVPGVNEFSTSRDHYRFYARSEGVHRLYLLLASESVNFETIPAIANDTLKNLRTFSF
ncbi:hypothetical protein HDU97_001214 [Phlyctochytrium planicorne]|nr:hypothetical protein HDU97_001214 [Phlyctochytrium planicorne]